MEYNILQQLLALLEKTSYHTLIFIFSQFNHFPLCILRAMLVHVVYLSINLYQSK